jgi:hypothetical protein
MQPKNMPQNFVSLCTPKPLELVIWETDPKNQTVYSKRSSCKIMLKERERRTLSSHKFT